MGTQTRFSTERLGLPHGIGDGYSSDACRGCSISRVESWLVEAPGIVKQCVWGLLVLAAGFTMEGGQQFMVAAQNGVPAICPLARLC